jgi:hypothetical protein
MTGPLPQEELEAGYPQGMPRYITHTSGIPFAYVKQIICEAVYEVPYGCTSFGYWDSGANPSAQGSSAHVPNVPIQ